MLKLLWSVHLHLQAFLGWVFAEIKPPSNDLSYPAWESGQIVHEGSLSAPPTSLALKSVSYSLSKGETLGTGFLHSLKGRRGL